MPELLATQLVDLVATTQRNLGRPNYVPLMTDLTKFTWFNGIMDQNRVEVQAGYGVQWDVAVNHSGQARNVSMGAQDNPQIVSGMVQAQSDWRGSSADYSFLGEEISMNRDSPERIVDLVAFRRNQTMYALAELMENNGWGPPVASTDDVTPWGVNTWFVKQATEGFTGGAPSGYTTIGLNPSTYPRWKHWAGPYSAPTPDDLVRKMRRASRRTNFTPPFQNPTPGTARKFAYYTNDAVLNPLEELLKDQNENIGSELAKFDGEVTFRRAPVMYVPKLDPDTTNPVYAINMGQFKMIVLDGWWLKETNIPNWHGQHTMSVHFLDLRYQWVCYDRRNAGWVLSNGTSYPS